MIVIRRFAGMLIRYRKKSVAAYCVVTVLIGVSPAAELWLIMRILDEMTAAFGLGSAALPRLAPWLIGIAALMTVMAVLQLAKKFLEFDIHEAATIALQQEIFAIVTKIDLIEFEDPRFYDILARARANMEARLLRILDLGFGLIGKVTAVVTIALVLFTIHWSLIPVIVAGVLPGVCIGATTARRRYALNHGQTSGARMAGYLLGLLIGREAAKEIRVFTLFDYLRGRWRGAVRHLAAQRRRMNIELGWLGNGAEALRSVAYCCCFGIVGWRAAAAAVTVGEFGMATRGILQFSHNMRQSIVAMTALFAESLYIRNLFELLDYDVPDEIPVTCASIGITPDSDRLAIRLENVSFRYPGAAAAALSNVNIEIAGGECVAIVGDNGAGKSTLVKLLLGLYRPTSGRILLGGKDLRLWSAGELRRVFSCVFQDFVRYELTVNDNLVVADRDDAASCRRRHEAATVSGAESFIERLPDGYATRLGPAFGGVDLSTGQWQRLALARCLARNARFVILDECTASIDRQSETTLHRHIMAASDTSWIIISHRLLFAEAADRIIVLDNGTVVEQGTHAALTERNGRYARILAVSNRNAA